ncbi:glutathione S-transferase family protein [Gluconobacter sp. NFX36]|uniref:glutathione S-transferase family protein n=1 Tax=Gluconobacter sp. NFX36 TaxID=2819535 RepID=UPI003CF1F308
MKLYYHPLSGHAHRAHLFLSLVGLPHELTLVDLAAGEQRTPEFLRLNAFGEIPVLDDDGTIIADSNAILVYVARKMGPSHWLPEDLVTEAEIQRWLSVAAGKITYGCCAARLVTVFGAPFNPEEVIQRAHDTLKVIEQTLLAGPGSQEPKNRQSRMSRFTVMSRELRKEMLIYQNTRPLVDGCSARNAWRDLFHSRIL